MEAFLGKISIYTTEKETNDGISNEDVLSKAVTMLPQEAQQTINNGVQSEQSCTQMAYNIQQLKTR